MARPGFVAYLFVVQCTTAVLCRCFYIRFVLPLIDVESDAQLRERIKLAPSQYSSAGSRSSYKFYAKSANAMITDVSVSSPVPGSVLIVPLTNEEETPGAGDYGCVQRVQR